MRGRLSPGKEAAETTTAEYIIVMCWWMQGGELRQGPIKAQVIDLFVEPSHLCISDATKARLFFSHQKVRLPRQQLVDNLTSCTFWIIERFQRAFRTFRGREPFVACMSVERMGALMASGHSYLMPRHSRLYQDLLCTEIQKLKIQGRNQKIATKKGTTTAPS